jgi:hypothetical protein
MGARYSLSHFCYGKKRRETEMDADRKGSLLLMPLAQEKIAALRSQ